MKKKSKKKKIEKQVAVPSDKSPVLLICFCLLVVLVHMIASFFPHGRIWGINLWAYFSPITGVIAGVLVLLVFLPTVNSALRGMIRSILSSSARILKPPGGQNIKVKWMWYLIFSLPFFLLFWGLRDRTHLLGDGAQILSHLNSGELSVKWSEPLEVILHLQAFQLAGKLAHPDAATLYAILSCLAGVVMLFFIGLLADFWGEHRTEKIFIYLILLGMGSIQLFFGYAEHYSFSYLFVFIFILSSWGYLEGKVHWFFPLFVFVLAASSHLSSLILFPSLLFLFSDKRKNMPGLTARNLLLGGLGLLFLVLGVFFYRKFGWTKPPFFVPFTQDRYLAPGYLLFSPSHLIDFLNQQLLVSPVGLAMILALSIGGVFSSLAQDKTFRFLLLVSISQLVFNFVVDPALGAARDWDMFSQASLGYTCLGLWVFLHRFRGKSNFGYLSLILVLTTLYSTFPWVAVNSGTNSSITRFQNLLDLDPKRSANGHFILIKYFEGQGMKEEAEKENKKYGQFFPEVILMLQATELLEQGKPDEAEPLLVKAEGITPKMPQIHNILGQIYLDRREFSLAEGELKRAVQLGSFMPGPYVNLADIYISRQEYDQAQEMCQRAIRLNSEYPQVYTNLANIYFMRGELARAKDYYEKAVKLDPKFADAYVGLGDLCSKQARLVEAAKMYQTALGLNPDLAIAHFRLGTVYSSLGSKEKAKEELETYLRLSPQGNDARRAQEMLLNLK
jgi:tetratricopeptide (TPR) repeat protein